MNNIAPQPIEAMENECTHDKLEFVRDTLADLQANVAWIQQSEHGAMASLALRGLVHEFGDLKKQIEAIQAALAE